MKEPGRAKRQKPFFRRAKESGEELSREEDGYDGYYEDVVPADNGEVRQSVDKTMLRNIALLIGGVLTVVGVCLAMMLLL